MRDYWDILWVEARKATRSRMPLWTALASLFMPLAMALMIFLARNPELSTKLGLLSAKANLMAYAATDWPAYLALFGMVVAAGGFFFSVLVLSWVFGREFVDGTLKDMLAVPVGRLRIVLAKFCVAAIWSVGLTLLTVLAGLATGALLQLPGGSAAVLMRGSAGVLLVGFLTLADVFPFAFLASAGRGYLLPVGLAILTVMASNLVVVIGLGEYFPWSIPALFAEGKSVLTAASYLGVALTGLLGVAFTYLWWKYADQNR